MRLACLHRAACAVLLLSIGTTLHAQVGDECIEPTPACRAPADAAVTLPLRMVVVTAGGNPVPGRPSTLGMRVPGSPRWSVALRGNVASASLPDVVDADGIDATLWGVNLDFGIGVFDGVTLGPTLGGFASIDILASAGLLSLPEDKGFELSSPATWAIGARVGVLRESFTAPGVSISAMYRSLPDVSTPVFANADQSVVSIRTIVGKRVLGLSLAGGVGYDRVKGSLDVDDVATVDPQADFVESRTSWFGSVGYTTMVLNIAAEIGWQQDGDASAGSRPQALSGGMFGGISFRLGI